MISIAHAKLHMNVVPNAAVFTQLIDTLWDHFRGLTMVIANDDKFVDSKLLQNWASSTAVREAPASLDD